MKRITLILSLILGAVFPGYSQTTAIPDANFEQALIDLGIDSDGIINQSILTSDAVAVTGTLNVSNKSISDLTGIDAFTGVTILDVRDNLLTTIDITGLTGLLRIEAGDNQLTSVYANGLSNLERLIIHNNQLKSIDLSGLSNLRYLYAYNNDFTNLDLSDLVLLQRLYVEDNVNLASIDISNMPVLDRLRCGNTSLVTLDVSQNPIMAEFNCSNNSNLTFVNLKNGANTVITNFNSTATPNLTCIRVDDESYSTANWTNIDAANTFSEDCSLSVNGFSPEDIVVYPNPVVSELTIKVNGYYSYELSNINGQLIERGTVDSNSSTIDVSTLKTGLYFISIKNDKNFRQVFKIQKR